MGTIIKFPKSNKRKKITDVLVERLTNPHIHVDLSTAAFTCVECGQVSTFDFTKAIFRSISFYCSGCGHGYRITNPMFAATQRRAVKDGSK